MSIKNTVLSTLFVSAIAFSGATQAQESAVERLVGNILDVAAANITAGLNEELKISIASVSGNFDFINVEVENAKNILPTTTVNITDVASTDTLITDSTEQPVEKSED